MLSDPNPSDDQLAARWGSASTKKGDKLMVVSGGRQNQDADSLDVSLFSEVLTIQETQDRDNPNINRYDFEKFPLPSGFAARYDHSVACLPPSTDHAGSLGGCYPLVFGGRDAGGRVLNDLWIQKGSDLDASTWSEVPSGNNAPPLAGHIAVPLPSTKESSNMLVFGGSFCEQDPCPPKSVSSKLWKVSISWNASSTSNAVTAQWTEIKGNHPEPQPGPRALHSGVLVNNSQQLLVYGGCSDIAVGSGLHKACSGLQKYGDLWELDLSEMAQQPQPYMRSAWRMLSKQEGPGHPQDGALSGGQAAHSAAVLPAPGNGAGQEAMVVVGGLQKSLIQDTWYWHVNDKKWVQTRRSTCAMPTGGHCDDDGVCYTSTYKPIFAQVAAQRQSVAFFYGVESVFNDDTSSPDDVSPWQITFSAVAPPSDSTLCGDGQCVFIPAYGTAQCICDGASWDDHKCLPEQNDFQWYLLYSAFGACILFFSFLARRLHLCCRRARHGDDLRRPLRGTEETSAWTQDNINELIGSEAPALVKALPPCTICFEDGAADLMCLPCRHVLCDECACKIFSTNLDCPFCRGDIEGAKRLKVDPEGEDAEQVVVGCKVEVPDDVSFLKRENHNEGYVPLNDPDEGEHDGEAAEDLNPLNATSPMEEDVEEVAPLEWPVRSKSTQMSEED